MATQMLGVRLTEREEGEIKILVEAGLFVSVSEFIRDSVRKNLASIKAIQIRPVSKAAAKKEILDYMKKHKESYASDISEELGIDLDLVFTVMKELNTEGVVE
jgi:Arc/MetJ-type ribon-helix-helix transcriptional regulator